MDLLLNTPINSLSYGNVGYYLLKYLKNKLSLGLIPIGQISSLENFLPQQDDINNIENSINKVMLEYTREIPSIRNFHEFDLLACPSKKILGLSFFEINTLDPIRLFNLKNIDYVLAPSTWAMNVLNNFNIQSYYVPIGYEPTIFKPLNLNKKNDTYTFLTVGKFELRKNTEMLIKIFNKLFGANQNIKLKVICHNPFVKDMNVIYNFLRSKYSLNENVEFIDWVPNLSKLNEVYNSVDCMVLPTRSEGFCLPALESLAVGLPLIITNYSAHTDFVNDQNSFLLKDIKLVSADDSKYEVPNYQSWFRGLGEWAEINEDELAAKMQYVVKNNIRKNEEGLKTAQNFTWEKSIEKLMSFLDEQNIIETESCGPKCCGGVCK